MLQQPSQKNTGSLIGVGSNWVTNPRILENRQTQLHTLSTAQFSVYHLNSRSWSEAKVTQVFNIQLILNFIILLVTEMVHKSS